MKTTKIIITSILSLVDAYVLYSTIGYLILAIKTPKIYGSPNTTFMGMYIMSITFGIGFLVLTGLIVFLAVKFFVHKKSKTTGSNEWNGFVYVQY